MKWYSYTICTILILLGSFCGLQLYAELCEESYVVGSIDITNESTTDTFAYSTSSVNFYNDIYDETNTYYFSLDLTALEDFNGEKYAYEIYLNNYYLFNATILAGSVSTTLSLNFYSTSGEIAHTATLYINIEFLSDKSTLSLTTISEESATYFEQYFSANGIKLYIKEIKE